jgi:hypothetical protein
MRRIAGSTLLILTAVLAVNLIAGYAAAGKMESPEPTVKSTVKGQYEISRSGEVVGVEDFIRTTFSNNVVVVETVYEVFEKDSVMVSGNNRLEYQEDSGFPRKYFSHRRTAIPTKEHTIEVTIDLFANVAVIDERQDERERRRVLELPAGCLFVEGNIANQLSSVLERFNFAVGGKQGFRAFDPLGGATTEVAIKAAGDSTFVSPAWVGAESQKDETLARYRYYAGRYPGIDLFVDANGVIKMIISDSHDMEYLLVRLDEQCGGGGSAK